MHSDDQAQSFARDLLKPGFPFSIRDKNNKRQLNANPGTRIQPLS
jgi:hypothetical protein